MTRSESPYALAFTGQALLPDEPMKEVEGLARAEELLDAYLRAVQQSEHYEGSVGEQIGLNREQFFQAAGEVQFKGPSGGDQAKLISDVNAYTHGAVVIPQIVLHEAFQAQAHQPEAIFGHSLGSRAGESKCFSGIASPDNPFMKLLANRGLGIDAAIQDTPSVMLRVRAEMEKVIHAIEKLLSQIAHPSILAAPKLVTVGCPEANFEEVRGTLSAEFGEKVVDQSPVAQAAHHTPLLHSAAEMLEPAALQAQEAIVFPDPTETLYYSNVTAQPLDKDGYARDVTDHLIKPANVRAMLENLLKKIEELEKIVILELPGRESLKPIIAMIAKSLKRKIETFTISSPSHIPGALEFIGA